MFFSRAAAATAVVSLLAVSCGASAVRPDGGVGLLPAGALAPDLVAYDVDDKPTRLADLRGKPVVVYFYPKDGTPGCTKEACAFRDAWARYERAGVAVVGVSDDSRAKHRSFQREHKLPFPLVADETGAVGRSYGVKRGLIGYSRVSFLVDAQGKIQRVWPDVDPGVHATEVLGAAAPAADGGT